MVNNILCYEVKCNYSKEKRIKYDYLFELYPIIFPLDSSNVTIVKNNCFNLRK